MGPADENELNHIRKLQSAEASTICHSAHCETDCAKWPSCGSIIAKNEGLGSVGMCIEFMLRNERFCCGADDILDGAKASLSAPCGANAMSLIAEAQIAEGEWQQVAMEQYSIANVTKCYTADASKDNALWMETDCA